MATPKPFAKRIMEQLEPAIYSALGRIGREGADAMKKSLRDADPYPSVYRGVLHDGITFAVRGTKQGSGFPSSQTNPGNPAREPLGPAAKSEHLLTPMRDPYTVKVGTRDPKAPYINYGTGPHKSAKDSDEFVRNIREWSLEKGLDTAEDNSFSNYLIKKIRRFGTYARPFKPKTAERMDSVAGVYFTTASNRAMRNISKVRKIISKNGIRYEITGAT